MSVKLSEPAVPKKLLGFIPRAINLKIRVLYMAYYIPCADLLIWKMDKFAQEIYRVVREKILPDRSDVLSDPTGVFHMAMFHSTPRKYKFTYRAGEGSYINFISLEVTKTFEQLIMALKYYNLWHQALRIKSAAVGMQPTQVADASKAQEVTQALQSVDQVLNENLDPSHKNRILLGNAIKDYERWREELAYLWRVEQSLKVQGPTMKVHEYQLAQNALSAAIANFTRSTQVFKQTHLDPICQPLSEAYGKLTALDRKLNELFQHRFNIYPDMPFSIPLDGSYLKKGE